VHEDVLQRAPRSLRYVDEALERDTKNTAERGTLDMKSQHCPLYLGVAVAFVSSLTLVACTRSPPTAELRGARDSIARAEYDGARQLAAQPFQMAKDKLAGAQTDVMNNDMGHAKNQAEEAQADADYADAVANAKKTATAAAELQRAQQKLEQQLQ
jgi:hypothetical protein